MAISAPWEGGRTIILAPDGEQPASWRIEPGTLPGCIALGSEEHWLGSRKDGSVFTVPQKSAWENFLPVSEGVIETLRSILVQDWTIEGNDATRSRLGLRNFNLVFDDHLFPLRLNSTLAEQDGRIFLRTETQTVCLQRCGTRPPPAIWINPRGNIGNRALQYLTAEGLRAQLPEARISNLRLDMWGIDQPAPRPPADRCAGTGPRRYCLDIGGLADCLRRGEVDALAIESFTFRVDHYPPRETCRTLFPPARGAEAAIGFGNDELLCNIRADEILRGAHPDYIPLPAGFYRRLEEDSGLELVFYGQLEPNPYIDSLREAFPNSRFIASQGAAMDFEIIRRSANIAVAISTFSWLAAWLSEARRIYVPVGGMLNPIQHPGQTYIVGDDPAYRYVMLPIVRSANLYEDPARFWEAQRVLGASCRLAEEQELASLIRLAASPERSGRLDLGGFDSGSYLRSRPALESEVLALRATALGDRLARD